MNRSRETSVRRAAGAKAELAAIDRILAGEDKLALSSGFVDAVMDRVREKASAPAPIPFPWKRALPGITLAAGGLGWAVYQLAEAAAPTLRNLAAAPPPVPALLIRTLAPAGWVGLALAVSLFSWLLARRIAGYSGYFG